MNLATCHRCPNRGRPCVGPCLCTISGRDIVEHAKAGDCPLDRFHAPDRSRGLGDTIAKITSAIGITPCGECSKRQQLLNQLLPYR